MELQSLGYIGLRAKNIEDWATVGPRLFGLELVERTKSTLTFRMDDRKQRIVIHADGGEGPAFFGFDLPDARALDTLAARLEQHGKAVTRFTRTLADERRVRDGISFVDPAGNRLEAFYGAEIALTPFSPGRPLSGFRTGTLGMGHVVLKVAQLDPMLDFYRDLLGFRISDYFVRPFRVTFMHLNPRHHTVGLLEDGTNGIHHMMIELFMLDDVGQGYDVALREKDRIAVTLGRHINDQVTSFYSYTPSNILLEYGWGGRSLDLKNWVPEEVKLGPSMWGHERHWLPETQRVEARKLVAQAAADGVRAPVNVVEGNFAVAPGVCPWLDSVRRAS